MAIDTTLYGVGLPAGTYTAGDIIPLGNLRGPAVVRDGYGAAYLKRIITGATNGNGGALITGHIVIKNSNWVDEITNLVMTAAAVSLAENSSNIQKGHDARLTPNSGWNVYFAVDETVTTTAATDVYALIDVDYPSVQAVQNPREANGEPVSMIRKDSITINAFGSIGSAGWNTYNVDILKAGYKYLLVEMGGYVPTSAVTFISLSGAAGQNGLERIIPAITWNLATLRYLLDYSTPLVKGPMNLNYMSIGTAGTKTAIIEMDWVKR